MILRNILLFITWVAQWKISTTFKISGISRQ